MYRLEQRKAILDKFSSRVNRLVEIQKRFNSNRLELLIIKHTINLLLAENLVKIASSQQLKLSSNKYAQLDQQFHDSFYNKLKYRHQSRLESEL